MNLVKPLELFGSDLCSVQNPAAYIGGEIGSIVKNHGQDDDLFNMAIAFPDLYTIGMSNQAIKIIYNGLNKREDIRCERVFAAARDFEELLKKYKAPLYTLETGMPLKELDLIGFSIGYELGITTVLSMLDQGGIPVLAKERGEGDPIVIAGGVGSTNPAAFSDFFDAVFIGEAENAMFDLIEKLAKMKKAGAKKSELLLELKKCPHVWSKDMSLESCGHKIATRAIYSDFGKVPSIQSYFPLPNVKPVQDHGVVEIMRGCPNGCRFCHAGVYYRPQRAKEKRFIFEDVDRLVNEAGYREISLTSLSSADYPDIGGLLEELNEKYKSLNVSFQLPSLKVNSFTLPILEQLSEVRKSGLTFAVETPDEAWQLRLNKEVYAQHLVDLILEAKKKGWNKAKFYFMVGLPLPEKNGKTEEAAIVDFMLDLQKRTNIQCNVNVGTFIPKPHTAYQWVRQISPEESDRKLAYIREHLPRGKFRVGTHDINTSYIEGLLSRGDERAGAVIYSAWKKGCHLDAWEDQLRENLPKWEEAFNEAPYDIKKEILRERSKDEILPWDTVSLGPAKSFYLREWQRNEEEVLTPVCMENCDHRCGVCSNRNSVNLDVDKKSDNVYKSVHPADKKSDTLQIIRQQCNIPVMYRVIFEFEKKNGGQFFSHLGMIEIFNRAILKSGLPLIYTTGFNPLPRLEFASTLSLGIASDSEIASVVSYDPISEEDFMAKMNAELVSFIQIKKCFIFPVTNQRRRESLSTGLWGSEYEYHFNKNIESSKIADFMNCETGQKFVNDGLCAFRQSGNTLYCRLVFKQDRPFRNALEEYFGKKVWEFIDIVKKQTLAKPDIIGWTPEINEKYQAQMKTLKKSEDKALLDQRAKAQVLHADEVSAGAEYTSYFALYEKIAAINAELIKQRAELSK